MKPGLLDMAEQQRHAWDVMLAILQPALWLLLCIGFVLASAHLLTMLGTRWGDRRVSPKALFFSIAIHLSLGVALVALIPEYRQHMLSLGVEEPPAVEVELIATIKTAQDAGEPLRARPAWERLPEQPRLPINRSEVTPPTPEPQPTPDRRSAIQFAAVRPVESATLPTAPEVLPTPQTATAPQPRQTPAEAALAVEVAAAEARPEVRLTEKIPERSRPQPAEPAQAEMAGRPPALESIDERPEARPVEGPLANLTTPSRPELPMLDRPVAPDSLTRNGPAPEPLPSIQPSPPALTSPSSTPAKAAEPQMPQRSRSRVVARVEDGAAGVVRPGLNPIDPEPRTRTPERTPLTPRNDPSLPALHRPNGDPSRAMASASSRVPASFQLRTDQDRKDEAIRKYGGNEDSQKAVERALRFFAQTQESDGRWNAAKYGAGNGPAESNINIGDRQHAGRKADSGVTALVLLAFLGNGNTRTDGPHAKQVDRAVQWLVSNQKVDGSLSGNAERFEAMYCHGMATLALAEAYAMETDALARSSLRRPLEQALAFTKSMQLEDGGWRYIAHQDGGGDMSMFGWQLLSFRSSQEGGLPMPDDVRSKMVAFLTARSRGASGGLAAYWLSSDPVTPAMTAEALMCKQLLGMKRDNPMAREAVAYLLEHRPKLSEANLYYWYYGTLAMFQHGGNEWTQWNESLRNLLVVQQVPDGAMAGSWEPRDLYSQYGGRMFSTAIATLCLEVYYRRLPMYQRSDPTAQ
ncbi:MAG: prenyltransferase/squalene oxidase repeat-containing protein [Planctomycetaceae bacterium]